MPAPAIAPPDGSRFTRRFTDEAIAFLERQGDDQIGARGRGRQRARLALNRCYSSTAGVHGGDESVSFGMRERRACVVWHAGAKGQRCRGAGHASCLNRAAWRFECVERCSCWSCRRRPGCQRARPRLPAELEHARLLEPAGSPTSDNSGFQRWAYDGQTAQLSNLEGGQLYDASPGSHSESQLAPGVVIRDLNDRTSSSLFLERFPAFTRWRHAWSYAEGFSDANISKKAATVFGASHRLGNRLRPVAGNDYWLWLAQSAAELQYPFGVAFFSGHAVFIAQHRMASAAKPRRAGAHRYGSGRRG